MKGRKPSRARIVAAYGGDPTVHGDASRRGRCIFCGVHGALTPEHVFSASIRKQLMGIPPEAKLSWNAGSPGLWAGASHVSSLDELSIRAVCARCNNEWMQDLDQRFTGSLRWWSQNPKSRLGVHRLAVIRQFMLKVLWVVCVGENWTDLGWIEGRGPEPEFIPLTLTHDGPAITGPGGEFRSLVTIGGARVHGQSTQLIHIVPVGAEGAAPTDKVARVNAAVCVTFRVVRVRLWCVASNLTSDWRARLPGGVQELDDQSRAGRLSEVSDTTFGPVNLVFGGPTPAPDLNEIFRQATERARVLLQAGPGVEHATSEGDSP